ncbi:hypothetical protein EVAR_74498_1 [Eumeta japonica]|uniref:Uncharacterized protein n=1 Tax=Eumeta variegata TaxID=151549 RepID=A0A4C1TEH8_EUMVA|nr:hypothetical protein EVAR_74498_1 [Eumeta japonica]
MYVGQMRRNWCLTAAALLAALCVADAQRRLALPDPRSCASKMARRGENLKFTRIRSCLYGCGDSEIIINAFIDKYSPMKLCRCELFIRKFHPFPLLTRFNEFKPGRTNLTDSPDLVERRPSTATTEDNISAVRLMIQREKRVIYQHIRTSLGIGTALSTSTDVRSHCGKFIYVYLSQARRDDNAGAQKVRRALWDPVRGAAAIAIHCLPRFPQSDYTMAPRLSTTRTAELCSR